jgi:hypothetical protein
VYFENPIPGSTGGGSSLRNLFLDLRNLVLDHSKSAGRICRASDRRTWNLCMGSTDNRHGRPRQGYYCAMLRRQGSQLHTASIAIASSNLYSSEATFHTHQPRLGVSGGGLLRATTASGPFILPPPSVGRARAVPHRSIEPNPRAPDVEFGAPAPSSRSEARSIGCQHLAPNDSQVASEGNLRLLCFEGDGAKMLGCAGRRDFHSAESADRHATHLAVLLSLFRLVRPQIGRSRKP